MSRVSIIVPCYNREHTLLDCLQSVCAQTYSEGECIIVDDESTDHSLTIAMGYVEKDSRFKLLNTRKNAGPSAARNIGIHAATGEFLLFLDSDDMLEPYSLEKRIDLIKRLGMRANNIVIYCPAAYFKDKNTIRIKGSFQNDQLSRHRQKCRNIQYVLVENNPFLINSVLVDKEAVLKVGGFDESLLGVEDWDLWLRLCFSSVRFISIDEAKNGWALCRLHEQTLSTKKISMLNWEICARKKWSELTRIKSNPKLSAENERRFYHRNIRIAIHYVFCRRLQPALSHFKTVRQAKGLFWCLASGARNLASIIMKSEIVLKHVD